MRFAKCMAQSTVELSAGGERSMNETSGGGTQGLPGDPNNRPESRAQGFPFLFPLLMLSLLVVGVAASLAPARTASGLPDDVEVHEARDLLHERVAVATGGLRFRSELTGDLAYAARTDVGQQARLEEARVRLRRSLGASPFEARTITALGHVELALRRDEVAESLYRRALDLLPQYGEARLGLGIALASRARRTASAHESRRLVLQATAQFASVRPEEPVYECALYDHALMLVLAGRQKEAIRVAGAYLARDATSPWANDLRAILGART
jgi:tetratricopeptide (TPR) repeat protein